MNDKLTRRAALSLGAAALAAPAIRPARAALPDIGPVPAALKGSGEVRIAHFGGTMQQAQRQAYFDPFEKLCGVTVRDFAGSDITKIKAQVDTNTVEWDIAQLSRGTVLNLQKRGDYFERIDYDIVDPGVDPAYRFEYGLEMLVWAQVLAYRTDAFKGAVPSGWADFWDLQKFPGDRTLLGGGGGNSPELEFALMAADVPPEKVYPMDIERAFASYDRVKKDVVKWWEQGAVPVQLLTDREVVLASVWNGRMAALKTAGVPAAISWKQGLLKRDCWAVPKGAKNRANAMKFIAFSTMAAPQARLSSLIPYGFVNAGAAELVAPEQLAQLPSNPAIRSQLLTYDYDWWRDNRDAVIAKWNAWILT